MAKARTSNQATNNQLAPNPPADAGYQQPPQQYYQQPQPQYQQPVDPNKGKSKFLTLEYAFSMMALLASVLVSAGLIKGAISLWSGRGGENFSLGAPFPLSFFTKDIVAVSVGDLRPAVVSTLFACFLAIILAVIAVLGFMRVSKTVPDKKGYTSSLAYKTITFTGFSALVLAAIWLTAYIFADLIGSLLLINTKSDIGNIYLASFLPKVLGLGVVVGAAVLVYQIINGKNTSSILSFAALGLSVVLTLAMTITLAVKIHNKPAPSKINNYSYNRNF